MTVKRLAPVLMVDAIEPVLDFWMKRLGFAKTVEVPHDGALGFVALERDGIQVMYQTKASVAADVAPLAASPMRGTFLFIEVDDLDAVQRGLADVPLVVPRRTTFYGSQELIVREPAGNAVTFAQFSASA